MTTPQQEHAARQRERARRIFRDELAALGIATDKHVERAVVRLASGFVLTIEPRHFGSSVDIMPFLPRDLAREVNDTPCDCFGGGYSDDNGRLGAVARPHGHAGGLANHNLRTYQRGAPVSTWHCDSIGALGTLLRVVARTITADGLTADAALLDDDGAWCRALDDGRPRTHDRGTAGQRQNGQPARQHERTQVQGDFHDGSRGRCDARASQASTGSRAEVPAFRGVRRPGRTRRAPDPRAA